MGALGLFGNPAQGMGGNGLFYGGNQLGTQLFAGLVIILWAGGLSVLIFLPLRMLGMLRMGDEFQESGADLMEHSPQKAYNEGPGVMATETALEHSAPKAYDNEPIAVAAQEANMEVVV